MQTKIITVSLVMLLGMLSTDADAKGCLKGAVVGGFAGHVAGHHTVAGAVVGCAVGHHMAAKKAREQRAATRQ